MFDKRNCTLKNIACPYCGVANVSEALFCTQCGASLDNIKVKSAKKKISKEKKGKTKKNIIPILLCVIAVIMAWTGIIAFAIKILPSLRQSDELFYMKDDELYVAKGSKYVPELVTDNFYEENGMVYGYEDPATLCQYTKDDYLFYMQNVKNSEGDLYYKKYSSEDEGTRIDFNVNFFHAYSKNCVIYRKDEKLYFFNGKDKEKLANKFTYCGISENGEYLYWSKHLEEDGFYTYTYDYHICDVALKDEKIIKDISRIVYMNDDYSEIYYIKDEVLYLLKDLEDVIKIESDIWHAWLSESEEVQKIYYLQYDETINLSLYDLIEDDVKNDRSYNYCREMLREWGGEEAFKFQKYILGVYSLETQEEKRIDDLWIWDFDVNEEEFIAYIFEMDDIAKIKFSKVVEQYLLVAALPSDILIDVVLPSISVYIIADNYVGEIPDIGEFIGIDSHIVTSAPSEIYVNTATNEIYMSVFYETKEGTTYDLYVCSYNNPYAEWRLITNHLEDNMINTKQGIYYFTKVDEDGREGTLFLNGTEIDDDVYPYYVKYTDAAIYYIRDIDSDKEEGTLYMYKNGKITEIADDVATQNFVSLEDGQIAYFTDYNYGKNRGDLYVFNGRENIKIDTDVSVILQ